MIINLWDNEIPYYKPGLQTEKNENAATLTPYLLDDGLKHGCVVICPGGAYSNRAVHEGEHVALWLNSVGISAFVLNYRVSPYRHPVPLTDGQRAIRHVRQNCDKYKVFPNKIGVLGFSAGGHLACSMAALYDKLIYTPADDTDKVSARPDAAVLCYPVVSMISNAHSGSVRNLLGENPADELLTLLSGEKNAHSAMPPVFLWHTVEDKSVPVENTLALAQALRVNNVPHECHIFNNGRHGIGLGYDVPVTGAWSGLCAAWLKYNLAL